MPNQAQSRLKARSEAAFVEAESQGIMLAATVRTVGLSLVLAWQAVDHPETGLPYYSSLLEIFVFVILGGLQYLVAWKRYNRRLLQYVFVSVDCVLMALMFSLNTPFSDSPLPAAIAMDTARFLFFFMILMQASFSFRPSLVVWCGFSIAIARLGMWAWFMTRPGVYTNWDLEERSAETWLVAGTDLNFLFLGYAFMEILVVLIVSGGLAIVVARSQKLILNLVSAERERSSLARYFSPNVVDRLSHSDVGFANGRQQVVAVLFADIVGFTKLCETASADEVIDLLRGYHDRLGKSVFANNGTLDKYIGDGLMATFGTPDPSPQDASNALRCAYDMIEALEEWNDERQLIGEPPVQVGIGVHWGDVIVGDIGNERRLEYSVIGDTVNIASRIEHMTRALKTPLVVIGELVNAVKVESRTALLSPLSSVGKQTDGASDGHSL